MVYYNLERVSLAILSSDMITSHSSKVIAEVWEHIATAKSKGARNPIVQAIRQAVHAMHTNFVISSLSMRYQSL